MLTPVYWTTIQVGPSPTMEVSMERDRGRADAELLSRSGLLKRGAVVGAVVALPAAGTAYVGSAFGAPATATEQLGSSSVLTAQQTAVLEAIVDRLIPADASGPGGKEAGVAVYIERSLAGGVAGGLRAAAPLYSAGLPAVDAYAKSKYGGAFTALSPKKQDAVLTDLATDKATGFTPNSSTFFGAVREHALQGMFSDPVYGGNKNFAGWKLLGYPGVKMPVAAGDQKLGVKVRAAHKSTYAGGAFAPARKEAES
jgi:gluconate 2-dehydrogenase gamma chain